MLRLADIGDGGDAYQIHNLNCHLGLFSPLRHVVAMVDRDSLCLLNDPAGIDLGYVGIVRWHNIPLWDGWYDQRVGGYCAAVV